MLEKAKWNTDGTPLDPKYHKPIKINLRKKDDSSSSGETGSSGGDLATDHRLRVVARRLPGYLTRRAAKDASTLQAQSTVGEETTVFGIFRRYYRQVLQTKTSSRPMLREMATLRSALDKIVDGSILEVADLLSQRLKSLEMVASGSDPMVATEGELLPRELQGLASEAESRYAHKEFQAGVRLNRALKGGKGKGGQPLGQPPAPSLLQGKSTNKGDKGQWSNKGKHKGNIKGKPSEESKVMTPAS